MAVLFNLVPFAANWEWPRGGSPIHSASPMSREPSPPGSISGVRGVGPSGATVGTPASHDSWSKARRGMMDGSSTLMEGEGSLGDNWEERPGTPTLLGYEILEERAKFTVYKILVTGGQGDSWVIFRRYTDFCKLNDKLKELFPSCGLALPPKRWFKDNYEEEFLGERQIGLQTFLHNLTLYKDVISSEAVRHFLCLVDPPSLFDSLEESRAFCETLEETNHRLHRELSDSQREVDILKKTLEEKEKHISLLVKKVKPLPFSSESFEGSCQLAISTETHRDGSTDLKGCKQQHIDEDDGG